jgi:hypothetical protein
VLADVVVPVGGDSEVTAVIGVKQGGEDARRVEPGTTEPVDNPVRGHQRGRLKVTDQAMLTDIRITDHRILPS